MAGISGLGTNYNLPNYTGILHSLTPAATPLFSAVGGLTGGKQTTSTEFEWSTYDLRNAGQPAVVEGATAPTAQGRVRANVTNVVQIHQEKVSVAYSKIAAYGQKAGSNNDAPSNVAGEVDWQVTQMLKQMVRDIEFSFLNGTYQKPADNSTGRKTRGLIPAITSNVTAVAASTITGLSAATDTITETSTALADGDKIVFTSVGASTAITTGRVYHVVNKSTNAFKVSETAGGSAVTIGTATVAYRKPRSTALATTDIDGILQKVWDNGGLGDGETSTLIVNSKQKLAISAAYAGAYGKFVETSRTVGGVAVDTIVTDFGVVNIMLNRFMPVDAIVVASLGELAPVYLEVPGKGHFFAEPLAKTGASDDVQLYGEVGLEYGPESHHGIITGLAV